MSEATSKSANEKIQIDISDENAWDDTLLIKAYDESLMLAKEEVAKKLASATNKTAEKKGKLQNKETIKYSVGDYIRATYSDGVDYEARILAVLDDDKVCLLKYIGYGNEEFVNSSELVPSWGKKARKAQAKQALKDGVKSDKNMLDSSESEDCEVVTPIGQNQKHSSGKKNPYFHNYNNNPYHCNTMSFPPPPPMPPMLDDSEESENLSAMLMSWYMSGYYTGLYQGQKNVKLRNN